MSKKFIAKAKSETNTYVYLWQCADHLLKQAQAIEEGRLYTCMSSIVFSVFALEGYFNHVGPSLFPYWDIVERGLNPANKLEMIYHDLKVEHDPSCDPVQAFLLSLKDVRNQLAHGRTVTKKATWETTDESHGIEALDGTKWKKLCNLEHARRTLTAAEDIMKKVHQEMGLGDHPLLIFERQSGTNTLIG